MKKTFIVLALAFLSLGLRAQQVDSVCLVDWSSIARLVKTRPDSVRNLNARLARQEPDSTLTMALCVLAFYGQTYLPQFGQLDLLESTVNDSIKKGRVEGAYNIASKAVRAWPLSLAANKCMATVIYVMLQDPVYSARVTEGNLRYYVHMISRLVKIIAATGDGSAESPYAVTSVADEYVFCNLWLRASVSQQILVRGKVPCDRLMLINKQGDYTRDYVDFDITRVMEIERQMFQ